MDTAVTYKEPLSRRINLRMIAFAGVLLLLIGYPVYVFLDSSFHGGIKELGNGYKEVDLKAMSLFPFNQINGTINDIPQKWRDLDGQNVVVYGEMWEPYSAGGDNVAKFELVYSISKCCFNGPPQIQHFVHAKAAPGAELDYYPNLVKVKGKMHVHVTYDPDQKKVGGVYWMDVQSIEPA